MISRTVRGYFGVVVGYLITGIMGITVGLLGFAYWLTIDWWLRRWIENPFEYAPRLWARILDRVVFRHIVGVRVHIDKSAPHFKPHEIVLWIGNHPSTMATASLTRFITEHTPRIVAIAKHNLKWYFWLPLWAIGRTIFIERDDPSSWPKAIRQGVRRHVRKGTGIIIFPDTHRPTPEGIAKDIREFGKTIPHVAEWLKYTRMPKSGGLVEILEELGDRPVRIVKLTSAFSVPEWGTADAPRICDATLYIRAEEVTNLPRDPAALQQWLNEEWMEKNDRISYWQRPPEPSRFTNMDGCTCHHKRP